ncbi:hypothetical protein R3P38DRAFT_2770734 [Favolaschia claudopus]|uniref:Ribosomal protein L5 n=1 Tax=Favolaschia claudopus TaxID=2862362 RepID=A0AAW0CJV0_9AGAR
MLLAPLSSAFLGWAKEAVELKNSRVGARRARVASELSTSNLTEPNQDFFLSTTVVPPLLPQFFLLPDVADFTMHLAALTAHPRRAYYTHQRPASGTSQFGRRQANPAPNTESCVYSRHPAKFLLLPSPPPRREAARIPLTIRLELYGTAHCHRLSYENEHQHRLLYVSRSRERVFPCTRYVASPLSLVSLFALLPGTAAAANPTSNSKFDFSLSGERHLQRLTSLKISPLRGLVVLESKFDLRVSAERRISLQEFFLPLRGPSSTRQTPNRKLEIWRSRDCGFESQGVQLSDFFFPLRGAHHHGLNQPHGVKFANPRSRRKFSSLRGKVFLFFKYFSREHANLVGTSKLQGDRGE